MFNSPSSSLGGPPGPIWVPCSSACSNMAENLRYQRKCCHFDVLAARKKTYKRQKACFFRYSASPPHPTAKPSWSWLRVGVRKPRLVLTEIRATWNKVTATPRSYWRGCLSIELSSPLNSNSRVYAVPRAHVNSQGPRHSLPGLHYGAILGVLRTQKASPEGWKVEAVQFSQFEVEVCYSPATEGAKRAGGGGRPNYTRACNGCQHSRHSEMKEMKQFEAVMERPVRRMFVLAAGWLAAQRFGGLMRCS